MFHAVGTVTNKVHAKGNSKSEVMRTLGVLYPTFDTGKSKKRKLTTKDYILPEPMKVVYLNE